MKETENVQVLDPTGRPVRFIANDGVAITKSDSAVFAPGLLYVGTGGNVKVMMVSGAVLTFVSVQDGSLLPVAVKMIYSTDTTASDFLILY